MRVELRINQPLETDQPILVVLLFTKKDEDYLDDCEDGIYNCASTMPDDKKALVSIIEQSINACIEIYENTCKD